MKTIIYPQWVEQYRSPGHSIKKLKKGYALYSCTSVYVKGHNPKSVQTYLGMIYEDLGFVPKTIVNLHPVYLEYALSFFIILNFKRKLLRSLYQTNDTLIHLGVISYVFGSCSDFFIHSSFLTEEHANEYIDYMNKISPKRIIAVHKKIDSFMKETFSDDNQRNMICRGLLLCVIDKDNISIKPKIPNEIKSIIERNGLDYE